MGEYEQALRVTQQGVEMARTLPNRTLLFFLLTVLGAVHQAMLLLEEAQAAVSPYLRALATLVRRSGETGEALASLQEVAILANEIGLPGELWQIEEALGEVYASTGHQAFARAMAIVQKLAANIEDEALDTGTASLVVVGKSELAK